MKTYGMAIVLAIFFLLSFALNGMANSGTLQQKTVSRIVFFVHWYDVGKTALEGLPGVLNVSRGFRGLREINTVTYDPDLISPERMIFLLKQAGTYIGVSQEQ